MNFKRNENLKNLEIFSKIKLLKFFFKYSK